MIKKMHLMNLSILNIRSQKKNVSFSTDVSNTIMHLHLFMLLGHLHTIGYTFRVIRFYYYFSNKKYNSTRENLM